MHGNWMISGRRWLVVLLAMAACFAFVGCSDTLTGVGSGTEQVASPDAAGTGDFNGANPAHGERVFVPCEGEGEPLMAAAYVDQTPDKATRIYRIYASDARRDGGTNWQNIRGLLGEPGTNDNQNENVFAYNDVMSSAEKVWCWFLNRPTLQPGERITAVYVDVFARYDSGSSNNRLRMFVRDARNTNVVYNNDSPTWSQSSSDDNFRWRMQGTYGWNITSLKSSWTMDDIFWLDAGVRRFANTDPIGFSRSRLNAMRVTVVTTY